LQKPVRRIRCDPTAVRIYEFPTQRPPAATAAAKPTIARTTSTLAALIRTDRNYQPAANFQLFLEGLRHLRPAGGHDDGIIGGMVRPSTCAVAMEDMDIVIAEFGQSLGGPFGERTEPLDRVDIGSDFGQHRGGIAGPSADLEDLFAALEHQGFGHEGDDIGLRNGLLTGDRQWRVFVGEFTKALGKKSSRGTLRIASRTNSSRTPRAAISRSTISLRCDGNDVPSPDRAPVEAKDSSNVCVCQNLPTSGSGAVGRRSRDSFR
jgi:hypothetical protein